MLNFMYKGSRRLGASLREKWVSGQGTRFLILFYFFYLQSQYIDLYLPMHA